MPAALFLKANNLYYEFIENFWGNFVDPKKRIFLGYLLSAILIAFFWLVFRKKFSIREAWLKIFDRKILFSKSSFADLKVFFINRVFTFFISPLLITQLVIATAIFNVLITLDWNVSKIGQIVPTTLVITLFTMFIFTFDDLTKYFVHRWMHKVPFLWALHKVHHSAEHLTPMTIFRTHPLEGIVFSTRSAFVQGISISVFFYFFGNKVDLATILGVNVFVFTFNALGSNLRHSHIGIRYWHWLEYVLISPAQHQLHHSVALEHYDKNFGSTLAIWDWIFGSLHHSVDSQTLSLGVKDEMDGDPNSLRDLYIKPLLMFLCEIFKYTLVCVNYFVLKLSKQHSDSNDNSTSKNF